MNKYAPEELSAANKACLYDDEVAAFLLGISWQKAKQNSSLEDVIAETKLLLHEAKCILRGFEQGISSIPNSRVQTSLEFIVPRVERVLKKYE